MRFLATLAIAVGLSVSGSTADAFWCWGGGWGWGSYYAPYYGGSYASYRPYYYGGYYSAGYSGCSSCGCSPCSCSPCGCSPCGVGACGVSCGSVCGTGCSGGACGAITSDEAAGPQADPGFREGTDSRERSRQQWQDRSDDRNSTFDEDEADRGTRPGDRGLSGSGRDNSSTLDDAERFNSRGGATSSGDEEPEDSFSAPDSDLERFRGGLRGSPGLGDDLDEPDEFEGLNEFRNKPAPEEPMDEESSLEDGSGPEARLQRGLLTENQARTEVSEAASRFRLAGQSSRRERSQRAARWSGRTNKQQRPLQWIGAPARDGRVRS